MQRVKCIGKGACEQIDGVTARHFRSQSIFPKHCCGRLYMLKYIEMKTLRLSTDIRVKELHASGIWKNNPDHIVVPNISVTTHDSGLNERCG
jgi:hypothetical protein